MATTNRSIRQTTQSAGQDDLVRRAGRGIAAMAGRHRLSLLAYITVVALVTPAQMSVGGLVLTPSRIVFLAATPLLLVRLLAGRYGRIVIVDYLILFMTFWVFFTIFLNNREVALVFGGMQALLLLGGYLAGRATIRSVVDFQALTRFLVLIVLLLIPFAVFEGVTSRIPMQMLLDALPGVQSVPFARSDPRLGLDRASVVFAHPIHWGLFCTIPISLYYVGLRNHVPHLQRFIGACLLLAAAFLSVSSGPLMAGVFQLALIGYLLVFENLARPWLLLVATLIFVYNVLELMSDRVALYAIADRIAFNSHNANLRRLLWEYGSVQVAKEPWIGVGFNKWDHPPFMSGSIDNYWLQLGIVYGLPGCFSILGVYLILIIRAGRGLIRRGTDLFNVRVASSFVLVSLILTLSTVTIWGEAQSVVFFILGAMTFLLQKDTVLNDPEHAPEGSRPSDLEPVVARGRQDRTMERQGVRYTRFETRKRQT